MLLNLFSMHTFSYGTEWLRTWNGCGLLKTRYSPVSQNPKGFIVSTLRLQRQGTMAARLPHPCGRRSLAGHTHSMSYFCTCLKS